MAKLTTQAGGVSLGRLVATIAGLATVMVLSRLLPRETYGTYRQVWLLFFTLAPILELGVTQSASFFTPQLDPHRRKTYFAQNGVALLVSGTLMGLVFLSCTPPLARLFGNPHLIHPLRAFALFPALTLCFNLTENSLVALGHAGKAGMISGASMVVQSAVVLVAFLQGASLTTVFACLSLWALLRWAVVAIVFLRAYRGESIHWGWGELRGQLLFALPVGAAAMVGLLTRQMDKVIVSATFPPERYAIYANGAYDIPLINILTMSVTAVLIPAIVRARASDEIGEVRRLWHGAARRLAALFFPTFCFLLVAARPFMVLLFSPEYAESAAPFRIYLLLLPLRIAFHSGFLRALGRTRPILIASAGAFLISLVLALALVRVPSIGFLGPAIAAVVANYWAAIYAIREATRILHWDWHDYFPWKRLAQIMGIALVSIAPCTAAGWLLRETATLPRLTAMALVYGGIYLGLGEATRVVRLQEWWSAVVDVVKQR